MSEPVGDATMSALHYALSGLALRQRTIADNTANIETPGFLAGKVSFEDTLRSSIADGSDPFATAPTTVPLAGAHPHERQQRQPRRGDAGRVGHQPDLRPGACRR